MNFYLSPITAQTISGATVNAPKYWTTDLSGLTFLAIPYGGEPMCMLSLAAPNAALAAETDVYSFPSDLTTQLADADATSLASFLTAANIPSDQIVSGMTFDAALQVIAKIFLVAQALNGASGAPIFTSGANLSTAVEDSDIAPIAPAQAALSEAGASLPTSSEAEAPAVPTQIGPFDFSGVLPSDSLGSMLDSLSQQISAPVNLGEFQ